MQKEPQVKYRYRTGFSYLSDPVTVGRIDLIQIGRLYCGGGEEIGLHPHLTWIELTVITGGRGEAEINGERVPLRAGDVHLSFPGDLHGIFSDSKEPLEYDFFSFWTKDARLLPLLEETVRICKEEGRQFLQDPRIAELVSAGIGEQSAPDEWSAPLLGAILEQVVYSVIRHVHRHAAPPSAVTTADQLCYQMMRYMETHVYSLKNLSQMADAMNYNYSYLSDVFRTETGTTLRAYLQDRKMERAKLLLREGLSLRRVAELLQYSSLYTFSRAFREACGLPPGQYRKGEAE